LNKNNYLFKWSGWHMIESTSIDTGFKDKIALRPGGERVKNCYLCGTCTAGCPVSAIRSEYSPRRFMQMILLGMKDKLLSSPEIWQCTQCHICVAHCPQDVRFADIVTVLRQMSIEEGYFPERVLQEIDNIDVELKRERIDMVDKLINNNINNNNNNNIDNNKNNNADNDK
jgi:heterodisulfide reductase subunit C